MSPTRFIGVVQEAGHATALTLVGRVEGQGDEPLIGEALCVDAGGLLLDPTAGVHDDDRGVGAVAVEVGGDEDVPDMVMSPFLNSTAFIELRPATDAGRSLGLNGAPLPTLDGAAVVSWVPESTRRA